MKSDRPPIPFQHTVDLERRYRDIREALQEIDTADIDHQLPNLTDTVRDASTADDTVRFRIGVSFTEGLTLLDYYLERVTETDHGRSVDELKERASDRHFYLEFDYPPDTQFDACALRGALLSAVDRDLRSIRERQEIEHKDVSGIWKQLSGFLE